MLLLLHRLRCDDVVVQAVEPFACFEFGEAAIEHCVDELLSSVLQRANLLPASGQRFFCFAVLLPPHVANDGGEQLEVCRLRLLLFEETDERGLEDLAPSFRGAAAAVRAIVVSVLLFHDRTCQGTLAGAAPHEVAQWEVIAVPKVRNDGRPAAGKDRLNAIEGFAVDERRMLAGMRRLPLRRRNHPDVELVRQHSLEILRGELLPAAAAQSLSRQFREHLLLRVESRGNPLESPPHELRGDWIDDELRFSADADARVADGLLPRPAPVCERLPHPDRGPHGTRIVIELMHERKEPFQKNPLRRLVDDLTR